MKNIRHWLLRTGFIAFAALGVALFSHVFEPETGATETAGSAAHPEAWRSMNQAEIQIRNAEGHRHLTVRVADEAHERGQGMQHLPARVVRDHPIWFVFPEPRRTGWHMRNVRIPLDIAYVNARGEVIGIERMEPGNTGYGIDAPIAAALELAAGEAERLGIQPGTRLILVDG